MIENRFKTSMLIPDAVPFLTETDDQYGTPMAVAR